MYRSQKLAKLNKHLQLELKLLEYNQKKILPSNRRAASKPLLRFQYYITIINRFHDNKVALNQDIRSFIRRMPTQQSYITARVRLTKTKYFEYSPWSTVVYQTSPEYQMNYLANEIPVLQTLIDTNWTELYRHEALYKPGTMNNWIQKQIWK